MINRAVSSILFLGALFLSFHSVLTAAPKLSATFATPTGTQNLTALGTSDWAHWGTNSSQISNFTVVNGTLGSVANYNRGPCDVALLDSGELAGRNPRNLIAARRVPRSRNNPHVSEAH